MNKDSIIALLRKNPKLAEARNLPGKHKIADAYLNQVAGGRIACDSQFSSVSGPDGFARSFAEAGC